MAPKTGALLEQEPEQTALAVPQVDAFAAVVERLAANKDVDVVKLQALIDMQKDINRENAKAAFNVAFTALQAELPEITEKGQIAVKGTVRSTYAKLEDIQAAIKPLLKQHQFSVRHRTEWPADKPNIIRIVGILSHAQGHSEESAFEAPMDKSEFRTDIQSMGSTVSYGRRYTTLDLLNITTRGMDKDGAGKEPDAPEGYQDWIDDIKKTAEKGLLALEAAWSCSDIKFKNFTVNHHKAEWLALKQKAQAVRS